MSHWPDKEYTTIFFILRFSLCFLVIALCLRVGYQLITLLSGFRTVLRWRFLTIYDNKWRIGRTKKPTNIWMSSERSLSIANTSINRPQIQGNRLFSLENREFYFVYFASENTCCLIKGLSKKAVLFSTKLYFISLLLDQIIFKFFVTRATKFKWPSQWMS